MQSGAVRSVQPLVARMRVQDIPPGGQGSRGGTKYLATLAAVKANLEAGLGPNEAFEVLPPGNTKYAHAGLLGKINKMIEVNKYPVQAFTREKDGRKLIYIMGIGEY